MNSFFSERNAGRMGRILLVLGVLAVLYVGMLFVNETKDFSMMDSDLSKVATIDVSGTGDAFAIPNMAAESFTVEQKAATIHDAQTTVSTKINAAVSFLMGAGVLEKDIQTTNYNAYPEYSYPNCNDRSCPTSQPKLLGYTVSQTITFKVRDTTKIGQIVDGLGAAGITGLTGPDFTVEDTDAVIAEARAEAIADAQEKAQQLAQSLGVNLVRVVRFSENSGGGYPPMPMYAKAEMGMGGAADSVLPVGQNKYTSNVTVTYEIQ